MSLGLVYQVMSCGYAPSSDDIPEWFIDAYKDYIEFSRPFWVSRAEYKRYGALKNFEKDIQKMLIEIDHPHKIRLVYFSDQTSSEIPEVSHVTVSKDDVVELSHELFHYINSGGAGND